MTISLDEARAVARLARLELSEEELARYTGQLDAILAYVAQLEELDTTGVEPTTHVIPELACPFREDAPRPAPDEQRAALVQAAPRHEEGFFGVPRIIE